MFVPGTLPDDLIVQWDTCCGTLYLSTVGTLGMFEIDLNSVTDTGTTRFHGLGSVDGATYWTDGTHRYHSQDTLTGSIHISVFDSISHHLMGNFALDVANTQNGVSPGDGSVIHITNGQLNLRYQPYP